MDKMENNRKNEKCSENQSFTKKAKKLQKRIKVTLMMSFMEWNAFGWCWIGGFGFDKYGNIYERKKVK
jgi:hypothetical protein